MKTIEELEKENKELKEANRLLIERHEWMMDRLREMQKIMRRE